MDEAQIPQEQVDQQADQMYEGAIDMLKEVVITKVNAAGSMEEGREALDDFLVFVRTVDAITREPEDTAPIDFGVLQEQIDKIAQKYGLAADFFSVEKFRGLVKDIKI